jgi:UDP-N-acetylmuramoyl-L-alanyl-D-glutamate--2,6-diaminopimelate ligase
MPSDSLSHLLETLDFAWRRASACPATLTNIQWRADACDPGSILFFQRFADGKSDGEIYERYLAASPCAVLVTNRMLDCFDAMPGKGIYVTRPGDWAETVRRFCDRVYPLDPGAPCFLGVTGTNGKTTTVKYLESMLVAQEQRVLTIGTLGVSRNGQGLAETGFTSPPLIELRRLLHAERGEGAMWWPWRSAAMPWTRGASMASPCGMPAGPTSPRTIWIITATRRPTLPPRPASST